VCVCVCVCVKTSEGQNSEHSGTISSTEPLWMKGLRCQQVLTVIV
jgi:hypothetical protein